MLFKKNLLALKDKCNYLPKTPVTPSAANGDDGRVFIFNFKLTLLMFLLIACLFSLGCWQLHRAAEKRSLLTQAEEASAQPFSMWSHGMPLPKAYQQLTVHGSFLPMTFFLDNQYDAHRWGYHVINPFVLASGELILIDRGWIVGDMTRQDFPKTSIPLGSYDINGQAYYLSEKGFILGDWIEPKTSQVAVIERIDIKSISNLLHKKVYPFIIRLDKSAPFGYERHWLIVSMSPSRHQAYAFQWFVMAFVVMVIYVGLSFKKRPNQ